MNYTEDFIAFFEKVSQNPAFKHRLYTKGEPALGLLKVQEYREQLLSGDFLDTYNIRNIRLSGNKDNQRKVLTISDDDIVATCLGYRPLQTKLSLPLYFLNHEGHSAFLDDFLYPGYAQEKLRYGTLYPTKEKEEERYNAICSVAKIDDFLYDNEFPSNENTMRKIIKVYDWWLTFKDAVFYFAASDMAYQKTFKCLLDHYTEWYKNWDKKIAYNSFGNLTGIQHKNFTDFCVRNGYHVVYNTKSWCLPWNKKVEKVVVQTKIPCYDAPIVERIQALGTNGRRQEAYLFLESIGLARRVNPEGGWRPEDWVLSCEVYKGEI